MSIKWHIIGKKKEKMTILAFFSKKCSFQLFFQKLKNTFLINRPRVEYFGQRKSRYLQNCTCGSFQIRKKRKNGHFRRFFPNCFSKTKKKHFNRPRVEYFDTKPVPTAASRYKYNTYTSEYENHYKIVYR